MSSTEWMSKCRQVQAPTNNILTGRNNVYLQSHLPHQDGQEILCNPYFPEKQEIEISNSVLQAHWVHFYQITLHMEIENISWIRSGYAEEGRLHQLHLHRHSAQSLCTWHGCEKEINNNVQYKNSVCYFRKLSDGLTTLIGIFGQIKHLP